MTRWELPIYVLFAAGMSQKPSQLQNLSCATGFRRDARLQHKYSERTTCLDLGLSHGAAVYSASHPEDAILLEAALHVYAGPTSPEFGHQDIRAGFESTGKQTDWIHQRCP